MRYVFDGVLIKRRVLFLNAEGTKYRRCFLDLKITLYLSPVSQSFSHRHLFPSPSFILRPSLTLAGAAQGKQEIALRPASGLLSKAIAHSPQALAADPESGKRDFSYSLPDCEAANAAVCISEVHSCPQSRNIPLGATSTSGLYSL